MENWLYSLLLTVNILLAVVMIWLILMQRGKGADMGAAFGSGASGSLFGASGSANFLSRSTAFLATLFFLSTLGLTYIASNAPKKFDSVMRDAVQSVPVLPTTQEAAPDSGAVPQDEGTSREQEIPR
ncbi:MAG: preprotein translocase subunit SecG [Zoogloeaceae bacterium]|jgi:preprotein translocase subunit SecG|nr:preprotein translocase subunit SecG [Zoogloeaceae bacterium]